MLCVEVDGKTVIDFGGKDPKRPEIM